MTYAQAVDTLPKEAFASSRFGYPVDGGYSEFWRAKDGRRWEITNGNWESFVPFVWTVCQVP